MINLFREIEHPIQQYSISIINETKQNKNHNKQLESKDLENKLDIFVFECNFTRLLKSENLWTKKHVSLNYEKLNVSWYIFDSGEKKRRWLHLLIFAINIFLLFRYQHFWLIFEENQSLFTKCQLFFCVV